MRGIVLRESLVNGALPFPVEATITRRYQHLLGGTIPVEVLELVVPREQSLTVVMLIAEALLPEKFYAHFLDDARMYVAFPCCVVLVRRGDDASIIRAQLIGEQHGIPRNQMRFAEIFEKDHPDSTSSPDR